MPAAPKNPCIYLKPPVPATSHRLRQPTSLRRLTQSAILTLCFLLLLNAFFFETFYIPTGSMAPELRGEHRQCRCPTCGNAIAVGKNASEKAPTPNASLYRKAFCPWCGSGSLPVAAPPSCPATG